MATIKIRVTNNALAAFSKGKVFFSNRINVNRIIVGDLLECSSETKIEPYTSFNLGNVICSMGSFSYSNSQIPMGLSVGRYCSIAIGLKVSGGRHPVEALSTSSFTYDKNFSIFKSFCMDSGAEFSETISVKQKGLPVIHHDVWIGANVTLNRGVTLSTGCVVAANSVVTRSVPPYAIVGGNPAQLIRYRFNDDTIAALLESSWWRFKFTDFASLDLSSPKDFLPKARSLDLIPFEPEIFNVNDIVHDNL